jgi:hypothetical protein
MNETSIITSEHPWEAARRQAKELSDTLSLCDDGRWYAHVFASERSYRVCFGSMATCESPGELPVAGQPPRLGAGRRPKQLR